MKLKLREFLDAILIYANKNVPTYSTESLAKETEISQCNNKNSILQMKIMSY